LIGTGTDEQRGQTLALMLIALPALIGAMGLAMDVGNFYFQYYRAQTAVDAAALAGAICQAESTSCTDGGGAVATAYATANNSSMTLNPNPVAAPFNDPAYCPSPDTPCEVTVSATQTVPYYFARLVGVTSGTLNVTATAVGGPITAYTPPANGNMMPIGLQYTTPYADASAVTLNYKFVSGSSGPGSSPSPGDWGFLAIGGNGDKVLKLNIQHGAAAAMAIWDGISTSSVKPTEFVQSEPGVKTGFSNMKNYRYDPCVGYGPANYPADSPCVICIPLVDWGYGGGCYGKCTVPIMGFAEFFVTGVTDRGSSGTVTATWTHHLCKGGSFNPGSPPALKEGAIAVQLIQ
jgi:Flp pilus assembly protein TadG